MPNYEVDILKSCGDLHGFATGSNDMRCDEAVEVVAMLKGRLADWEPSFSEASQRYDDTVRALAQIAVSDAIDRLARMDGADDLEVAQVDG